jgi:hypothetical protein
MVVDLPAPFGPRTPVMVYGSTVKVGALDGDLVAVAFGEAFDFDHRAGPFARE